jgi:hypothetical protein
MRAPRSGMFVRRALSIFAAMLAGIAGLSTTEPVRIGRAAEPTFCDWNPRLPSAKSPAESITWQLI